MIIIPCTYTTGFRGLNLPRPIDLTQRLMISTRLASLVNGYPELYKTSCGSDLFPSSKTSLLRLIKKWAVNKQDTARSSGTYRLVFPKKCPTSTQRIYGRSLQFQTVSIVNRYQGVGHPKVLWLMKTHHGTRFLAWILPIDWAVYALIFENQTKSIWN